MNAQTNTWINVLLASYRYLLVCHKQYSARITLPVVRTSVLVSVVFSSFMYVPYFLSMGACRKPTRAEFDELRHSSASNTSFSQSASGLYLDGVIVCKDGVLRLNAMRYISNN